MKIAELSFLVVEDNDFQRDTVVAMLKRLQARNVYAAADGRKALDILANLDAPVDVILSDLEMPTMDGMELIRHVGAGGYRNAVIIASALEPTLLAAVETMTKAYKINLLGVLNKPITVRSLDELLARYVPVVAGPAGRAPSRLVFTLDEIMDGLEQNEFEAAFQPKIEIASRHIIGAEALARWRHPQQGLVPPSAFIRVLEDAGKIDELLWVMLRRSAAFCSALNTAGKDATVAVNLSLTSLHNLELANRVAEIMQSYNIAPRQIVLEVTESAATTDVGRTLENLTRLRMKGFGLAIDDYGTGYSSMQQLTRIPFTELKIDRSFVTNAATHETAKVILNSSIDLAKKLKIAALAEGVETQREWDLLEELGCDLAQGYFIARPMPLDAYLDWLQNLGSDAMTIAVA